MNRFVTRSLDVMLTDALRDVAEAAPMPDGLFLVPRESLARPRPAGVQAMLIGSVVAAAAITTVAILGLMGWFIEDAPPVGADETPTDIGLTISRLDVDPRTVELPDWAPPADGPVIEVVRGYVDGKPFSYVVYRAAPPGDACIAVDWATSAGAGCGSLPGRGPTGGLFGLGTQIHGSSVAHEVSGLVSPTVAEVRVETSTGDFARAFLIPLDDAELEAQFFFAFLPGGVAASAWVALDSAGNEIARFETPPAPSDPASPTPMPTPAD